MAYATSGIIVVQIKLKHVEEKTKDKREVKQVPE